MWTRNWKGIGIVVCNFSKGDIPHAIDLRICDTVIIEQQCEGWYKGYLYNNKDVSGIFPSAYVHVKQVTGRAQRYSDSRWESENEAIVEELTETLKEWNKASRKHFIESNSHIMIVHLQEGIKTETAKLLALRTSFTSPYLTLKQKTQLRTDIANKIDWGNKKLGLDMVPRVDGMRVDIDSISPVELYQIHRTAITKSGAATTFKRISHRQYGSYNSHHLYMQLKGLSNAELSDDLVIFFSLYNYNAGNPEFISERVMCGWSRNGNAEGMETSEYFSAMFVDLTTTDLNLEDAYLTAHIYKLSGLKAKESNKKFGKSVITYKRPYGCAALAFKEVLQSKNQSFDAEEFARDFSMPLVLARNRDDDFSTMLDHHIRRIKERKLDEKDLETVNVALGMCHGEITAVKQEYLQLFTKKLKITQKLGFADVIAPEFSAHCVLLDNEVRNDLYVNLYEGEFEKGNKSADKNVEAKVLVVSNSGEEKVCISGAGGELPLDHYEAAVFYHSNKPRWNEVVKISLAPTAFHDCHLRIEFRHCSQNAAEKKLFAFAYLPLEDQGGTTVQDRQHNLCIYKPTRAGLKNGGSALNFKQSSRVHYLGLSFEGSSSGSPAGTGNAFCSLSPKETCSVRTTLCSTKLTQDVNLVNLFKWSTPTVMASLDQCLRNVQRVKGDELMRHHTDFLNCLFSMTCDVTAGQHQPLIFAALIHILKFTKEKNYKQFMPMFELYIEKTFCAPLVHRELLSQIQVVLESQDSQNDQLLIRVINVLDLLFKFIVRSALLYAEQREDNTHHILLKGMEDFWKALQKLIKYTGNKPSSETKLTTMSIISRVVDVFPDLLGLLPADKLASSFSDTISKIPKRDSDMGEHKLKCLSKLINSPLFEHDSAREIVLELCNSQLNDCLQKQQDLELASRNLADLLAAVYRHKSTMKKEVEVVLLRLMNVVCVTILDCTDSARGLLVSCLITMLSMMDQPLVEKILQQQKALKNERQFCCDMFKILTDNITKCYIPSDWVVQLMVNNSVTLSSTKHFSQALSDSFLVAPRFNEKVWGDFFQLCVQFITQPCLQLENFGERKQTALQEKYTDMRLEMGDLLLNMWKELGNFSESQGTFIPYMVGPFLEVALLPERGLRQTLIPVFYDMLITDFDKVKREIVERLDEFYNAGKGDLSFKTSFAELLLKRAGTDSSGHSEFIVPYVSSVSTLIDFLLDYRSVVGYGSDCMNTLMMCTVNLLDFYQSNIECENIYSRYIYKLKDLNLAEKCYTEAGFTMLLLASRLEWNDAHLVGDGHCHSQKQWERKERHYIDIIDYFDKGQSWENAIPLCKELANLYETRLYDFVKLASILQQQARLFSKIVPGSPECPRLKSKYYRIAFYGQSYPHCVRDKSFVYMASAYTGPGAVIQAVKMEYPHAQQLPDSIAAPDRGQLQPNKQYFQSVMVEPSAEVGDMFTDALTSVDYKIADFYQWNYVQTFIYDKPFHSPAKDKDNEFRTLHKQRYIMRTARPMPGILHWCELGDMTQQELRPIEVALESLGKKNVEINGIILKYRNNPTLDQNELSMMLNGTIDAKVNGGIPMYQRAFLAPEFAVMEPDCSDKVLKLKRCITEHVMLLRDGLDLFREIANDNLRPLMAKLVEEFNTLKDTVKDADPSFDVASLRSMASSNMISEADRQEGSPRVSSGYSSSDVETQQTPKRKTVSVGSSSPFVSEQDASRLKRQDGQLMFSSSSSKPSRGNSVFYTESDTPTIEHKPLPEKRESVQSVNSSSSDDGDDKKEGNSTGAVAPPIPTKVRSQSLSVQSITAGGTGTQQAPPGGLDITNRPLPDTPDQRPPKLPARSKTMRVVTSTQPESCYGRPRDMPTDLPRPLHPTPISQRLQPPLPVTRRPPPVASRRSVDADDERTPPPLPRKSVMLKPRNKSTKDEEEQG